MAATVALVISCTQSASRVLACQLSVKHLHVHFMLLHSCHVSRCSLSSSHLRLMRDAVRVVITMLWTMFYPSILLPIITHFNPTQPQRQPNALPLSAGFRMSGVPVQSTRRDTGMCTKAVTASYCCQCWRLSSPQKSQLAHCGCLIFNTTEWLLFPPLLTVLEFRFEICKKAWQGIWNRGMKTFLIPKGQSLMHMATMQKCPQQCSTKRFGYSVTLSLARPDCWWDSGFMDPISSRRKWVRFVALELWEQINRMLISKGSVVNGPPLMAKTANQWGGCIASLLLWRW